MPYQTTTDILIASGIANQNKQPALVTSTGAGSIDSATSSVSFYNFGGTAVTITVNGVANTIPTGVTLNFNAGGSDNKFPTGEFSWNATGGSLIISYVY
jgi:hypothetical protein